MLTPFSLNEENFIHTHVLDFGRVEDNFPLPSQTLPESLEKSFSIVFISQ